MVGKFKERPGVRLFIIRKGLAPRDLREPLGRNLKLQLEKMQKEGWFATKHKVFRCLKCGKIYLKQYDNCPNCRKQYKISRLKEELI